MLKAEIRRAEKSKNVQNIRVIRVIRGSLQKRLLLDYGFKCGCSPKRFSG